MPMRDGEESDSSDIKNEEIYEDDVMSREEE